jgi:hypothetical protein
MDSEGIPRRACTQVSTKRQKLLGLKTKDKKLAGDEARIAELDIKANAKVGGGKARAPARGNACVPGPHKTRCRHASPARHQRTPAMQLPV